MTTYNDYIGAEDIKFWDGVARTFTRQTSTGGNITLNKTREVVNILEVYGSGSAYTDVTLSTAISSIGSRNVTIVFTPGTWTIAGNVTIPSNISVLFVEGAILSVNTGITLTINSSFFAGNYQIFTGAGTVTFARAGSVNYILPQWWGAKADGSNDDTTALNSAVTAAKGSGNTSIFCPHGQYKITGTITISQGVMIVCPGSQGSTQQYGTTFLHYSNSNLFVWDGNGSANAGTGGGLKNALILKAAGYSGGDAIKLLATDDNHRPGEMVFDNVMAFGTGSGLWARGFNIDGTACTTAGSKGVRSVVMNKVRAADCTTNDEYIVVNQGVHITGAHVQIDTGGGTGTCGMTVKGDSENVNFSNLILNGNLKIDGNATHVNIHGRVSALDVVNASCIGTATFTTTNQILNAAKTFKITDSNLKPAFLGIRTTAAGNVTGDATAYTVLYDSETYDKNSDFDPATGIFTANVAGIYQVDACVNYSILGAAHTRTDTSISHLNSLGSTIASYAVIQNPYAISAGGYATIPISIQVDMSKGDTLRLIANVSGGAKLVGVYGAASTIYTWFKGHLI